MSPNITSDGGVLDLDDLCPEVSQMQGGEGTRPVLLQGDDPDAR